jgi:DNA mismatch endonuclease (patch repair protein)
MADTLSAEKRSWNMSKVKGKNTKIELTVRKYLFSKGFRYRVNVRNLPGKPDIVLKKYNTVIFIHGCFWHRHPGCKDATTPKTRTGFWESKFKKNVQNDIINIEALRQTGWQVIILWECQIEKSFEKTMLLLVDEIKKTSKV